MEVDLEKSWMDGMILGLAQTNKRTATGNGQFQAFSHSTPTYRQRTSKAKMPLVLPPFLTYSFTSPFSPPRATMSSSTPPPPPPENRVVLGCGALTMDFLATVDSYPKPDDKIRSTSLKVQGGGNAGNALTCAARLGLSPRLISKVADDAQGRGIREELESDGVDTSFIVVSREGNTPFTYIIVDKETKTRTCIHTPGYPPLLPDELTVKTLDSALDGASIVYLDGRLHETALVVAREANLKGIPILVDAERKREGLDGLLNLATYVVCSARFPQAWTEAPSIPTALVSILLRLPNVKFVIVTLGEHGSVMLERSSIDDSYEEEAGIEEVLESLKQNIDSKTDIPECISSLLDEMELPVTRPAQLWLTNNMLSTASNLVFHEGMKHIEAVLNLKASGFGTINGRLLVGTAEKITAAELVDTTGAGDAFIGSVLYALCADMPAEKMLPFAALVAGAGCKGLGARSSLPYLTDPSLTSFLA